MCIRDRCKVSTCGSSRNTPRLTEYAPKALGAHWSGYPGTHVYLAGSSWYPGTLVYPEVPGHPDCPRNS
eukprot:3852293-Rhodomonas_salina.1